MITHLKTNCKHIANTPFSLQAMKPAVIDVRRDASVLELPFDILMRTCDTVANRPIP